LVGVPDLLKITAARSAASSGAARGLRVGAGLSLREVADDLGVSVSTVFRWENGERRPSGELAERYGELLAALADRHKPKRRGEVAMTDERPTTPTAAVP
jgi:transcriptional regulator with XRE-family HTH domain